MNQRSKGFTMIELMLAMAFVSVLLLAIAMLTVHISNIYNKGITLQAVNQAGQAVTTDMQRTLGSSTPFALNTTPPAPHLVDGTYGGRLCLGSVSYVWNYATAFQSPGSPPNTYTDGSSPPRFARVIDTSASLCSGTAPINKATQSVTDLLAEGDRDLMVHTFTIDKITPTPDTNNQALYHINIVIGTSGKQGAINTSNYTCEPPNTGDGYETYCAVNQFDFVVRAGNRAEGAI